MMVRPSSGLVQGAPRRKHLRPGALERLAKKIGFDADKRNGALRSNRRRAALRWHKPGTGGQPSTTASQDQPAEWLDSTENFPMGTREMPARRWGWSWLTRTPGSLVRTAGLGLMIVLAGSLTTRAGAERSWIGKRVVQKSYGDEFRLRIGRKIVDRNSSFSFYRVLDATGPWLWLKPEREGPSGWVKADEIVAVEQAIDFFTEQIDHDPAPAFAFVMRARLRLDIEEWKPALSDYNEAIRREPNPAWIYASRADFWRTKKDYNQAISDSNQAIQLDPTCVAAYVILGLVYGDLKEYDDAIALFNEAIRLDAQNARAYAGRGYVQFQKKDYDKAIADDDEAIRLDPRYVYAYDNRGSALFAKKDHDDALDDYNTAIRLDPRYAYAYSNRGSLWLEKREYDKAMADYDEAIRLGPPDAYAYANRGRVWAENNELAQAIADYNRAIQLDPRNTYAYQLRGHAWLEQKQYDQAIADYSKAIRLDRKNAFARADRGDAWLARYEYGKAMADYDEAIQLDPKLSDPYRRRGWILATCPDTQYRDGRQAVEAATKACELSQWKFPDELTTLAAAYAEAGDFESALKWQSKANALYSYADDEKKGEARFKLYQAGMPCRDPIP
jgi:tetratricopeptide (TPR) repeat protein